MFFEVDNDCREVRKIFIYQNGSSGYSQSGSRSSDHIEQGGVFVSEGAFELPKHTNEFVSFNIDRVEFERVWTRVIDSSS